MPETKMRIYNRKRKNAFACRTQRNPSGCGKRRTTFAYSKWKSPLAYRKRYIRVPKHDEPVYISEAEECACEPEQGGCICPQDQDEPVTIPEPDEPDGIPAVGGDAFAPEPEAFACEPETETVPCQRIRPIDADFLRHMSQYIGMTVTVYTASGGESGCGVTGVLIVCADSYVRLLILPASAPQRPQGLCRACPFYAVCSARKTQRPQGACLGAMVDIPVEHITIFVHSAVCGDTNSYNT